MGSKLLVTGLFTLPLAAVALAVFLLGGASGSTQQAHAAGPVNLSLSTTGCDSSLGPMTCSVTGGSTFTVSFNVLKAAFFYDNYDLDVTWSGNVNYRLGSISQPASVGTSCAGDNAACFYHDLAYGDVNHGGTPKTNPPSELANGTIITGGSELPSLHPLLNSTYTGSLATLGFVCKSSGTGTITLVARAGFFYTHLGGRLGIQEEADTESLTVNCGALVGGIVVDPDLGALALQSDSSSSSNTWLLLTGGLAMAMAGMIALGGGVWYARRRRVQ